MKPRCKSFDTKTDAEKWARELESQVEKFGAAPDTRILESTTLGALMKHNQPSVALHKRSNASVFFNVMTSLTGH